MSSDLITISSSVIPMTARVVGFRGTESISKPYAFEIFITLPQLIGEEFDLADAIGAKAKLLMDREHLGISPFMFAGIFSHVEMLHAFEGRLLLRAVLVPRLWQLGLSVHNRMFTKMKVPDIITTILEENGVTDYELRLGSYEVEEHVCQYGESDLAFISRWMEREGIFYFFEHSEDGEKLILCDQKLYDDDEVGTPVRYFPQVGHDHSSGPAFRSFTCQHATVAADVRLRDYDYLKPNLAVMGTAKGAQNGAGEVNRYGQRFFSSAAGDKLAKVRAEEILSHQIIYKAKGNRLHMRPGYTWELEDHPFPSFNAKYLTIEARHVGNQGAGLGHFRDITGITIDEVYMVEVDSISSKLQVRAESVTPWPRIYGYENGIVDGPAESEYAQIDDQGRYNCKFKFDESKLKNGKATTWVRMMQPHGGDIEGFHFPLRKNTEVIFAFMGGDPDRPVIIGVVPNTTHPSPVTQSNYTKNVIQTGARNRLEIEDKSGNEWIRFSTPYATTFWNMGLAWPQHELNFGTTANAALTAQGSYDIAVGNPEPGPSGAGNMTVHVLNNLTTTVDNVDMRTTVSTGDAYLTVTTGKLTETIKSDTQRHVETGNYDIDIDTGKMTTTVKSDITTTTESGNYTVKVESGKTLIDTKATTDILSEGTITMKSTGEDVIIEGNEVKITSRANLHRDVHGTEWITKHEDTHEEIYGNETRITHGDSDETTFGSKMEKFLGGTDISLSATGFKLEAAATGADIDLSATGAKLELDLTGFKLTLEAGLAIELNLALTIKNSPLELIMKPLEMSEHAAKVITALNKIHVGALRVDALGLHVEA